MRSPFVALPALALAVACGSSSSSSSTTSLTGKINGQDFTPAEIAFVPTASASSCTFDLGGGTTVPYAVEALLVGFSKTAGMCGLAQDPCAGKKNFVFAAGAVAHVKLNSSAAPTLATGTYKVYPTFAAIAADPAAVDPVTQEAKLSLLSAETTDATCARGTGLAASGTIRIDTLSSTQLTGFIDVTFTGGTAGDFLRGNFTATPCAARFDVCAGGPSACTGTPTCQ